MKSAWQQFKEKWGWLDPFEFPEERGRMVASLLFWTCLIPVPMISLGYWALVILI